MPLGDFLAACREVLGERHVVEDPDVTGAQSEDWTRRWRGHTPAVLRPGSVDDVAAVVRAAARSGVPLVPQGGNTGLVGGAVPHRGEVVVDLRRLAALGPVDLEAAQVTVGAGATLAGVQAHLRGTGLELAVDLGSRGTATIGGMVATNAGGLHVLRHGSMRAQVLGLTAVLGTGAVVSTNPTGLVKDNTGYDLAGLLCGSEGTLGIVTDVRLRLVPAPPARLVALLGVDGVPAALAVLAAMRPVPTLSAAEVVLREGVELVAAHLGAPPPLVPVPPVMLLVELAGAGDLPSALAAALAPVEPRLLSSAVAVDAGERARLWRWREAHTEAIAAVGVAHKADVTLPLGGLAAFVGGLPAVVAGAAPGARWFAFGHLGDGNLHVSVVGPPPDEGAAIDAILEAVLAHGGSVSAEHGIGVAKRHWLVRQRGPEAVAAMAAVKRALDPEGILNPGVLLP